jgi:hypothetical protein
MKPSMPFHRFTCLLLLGIQPGLFQTAAFDGPYSLTPPEPGVYEAGHGPTTFGGWDASGVLWTIDTSKAPGRLTLEVPAHSFIGNELLFSITATADGAVRFDCTAVSGYPGAISWMVQPSGTNRVTYLPLDDQAQGVGRHVVFPVKKGDLVGFLLMSGGDVILPDDPLTQTLGIENFSGPMPAPTLVSRAPGVLQWKGEANVTYRIETTTRLNGDDWLTLGTVVSTNSDLSFTHQEPQGFSRFYRAVSP